MGKFSRSWEMMKESWYVLQEDKKILVFPLLSGLCCMIVLASFAYPLFGSINWQSEEEWETVFKQDWTYYAVLLLFYITNYFVILFFNSALIACAAMRMSGNVPTVSDGFKAAFSRIGAIFEWACLCAIVGVILQAIEDRSKWLGRLVASLLGMAWTLVSFLVIPILVIENQSPFSALKKSTILLKKTWGEQLIGNFGFGLVFLVLMIPAFAIMIFGFVMHSILMIVAAVIYCIVLLLVQSALTSIYRTAVYLYARNGQAPRGFEEELLNSAITRKGE